MEAEHHHSLPTLVTAPASVSLAFDTSEHTGGNTRSRENSTATTWGKEALGGSSECDTSVLLPKPAVMTSTSASHSGVWESIDGGREDETVGRYEECSSCCTAAKVALPTTEAEQRAVRACETRLRLAQAAEVSILQRLHACVSSLLCTGASDQLHAGARKKCSLLPLVVDREESACQHPQDFDRSVGAGKSEEDVVPTQADVQAIDGGVCHLTPRTSTLEVLLPVASVWPVGDAHHALSSVQAQRLHVPAAGLTQEARVAYDTLRHLLLPHNQTLLPAEDNRRASPHVHASWQASASCTQQTGGFARQDEPHMTAAVDVPSCRECDDVGTDDDFLPLPASTLGETRSPRPRVASAKGQGMRVSCLGAQLVSQLPQSTFTATVPISAASSPRPSATPLSTPTESDDEAILFPPLKRKGNANDVAVNAEVAVPPRSALTTTDVTHAPSLTTAATRVGFVGEATCSADSRVSVPSSAAAPLLRVAANTSSRSESVNGPRRADVTAFLAPSLTEPQRRTEEPHTVLPSHVGQSTCTPRAATRGSASSVRAEMTATDILATITALPPSPPSLLKSRSFRAVKHVARCSGKTARDGDDASAHTRRNVGKRSRRDVLTAGDGRVDASARALPIEGLPYLGMDVEAAAVAAATMAHNRWCSPSLDSTSSAAQMNSYVSNGRLVPLPEGTAERCATASSPFRGYVRTRQQRAVDVAEVEAVFQAVRRTACGAGGLALPVATSRDDVLLVPGTALDWAGDDALTRSLSEESLDTVQHTPSQYWEIDFPER
jgi:hypothetical protein